MRKIVWLCMLLFVLMIVGCAAPNKGESKDSTLKNDLQGDVSTEQSYSYLIEDTKENIISIKMPEDKQYNTIIEEHILKEIRDTWGQTFNLTRSKTDVFDKDREYSDFYIELNATISFASEDVVSVVVEGLFNKKTTAHPTHWFFTINFNPQTYEIVRFSDYYELDARVYELFSDAIIKKVSQQNGGVWPEILGDFSDHFCSQEDFLRDMADGTMYYYFTEDGVGISCQVIFALGNHWEAELPYDVLVKKRDEEKNNIVKECNCMVFVNGQELGGKYYSYIDYQEKYAKIPLIQILETLGASVTWENKNNAVILFGNKKYLLDMMENSIIESGMKNNLIAPPPGISHPCCFEVGEKEFVIDTDSVRRFLKLLKVTISIDYESSKIYISTIDN